MAERDGQSTHSRPGSPRAHTHHGYLFGYDCDLHRTIFLDYGGLRASHSASRGSVHVFEAGLAGGQYVDLGSF
jgi:hypothetical protein